MVIKSMNRLDPSTLNQSFAAGTIVVHDPSEFKEAVLDGDESTSCDSWHPLQTWPAPTRYRDPLLRQLSFLAINMFVRITCRLDAGGRVLFIRVYLVPQDFPNVARYRYHNDSVTKEGSRYLHAVLPLVTKCSYAWDAQEPPLFSEPEYFLPRIIVRVVSLYHLTTEHGSRIIERWLRYTTISILRLFLPHVFR